MLLLVIITIIYLFILWTMLKCASIYDEIEEKNNQNKEIKPDSSINP